MIVGIIKEVAGTDLPAYLTNGGGALGVVFPGTDIPIEMRNLGGEHTAAFVYDVVVAF